MSKNTRTRILLTAVAALLLVTMAVGGTLAWLVAETNTVENTFTTSTLDVDIKEDGAVKDDDGKLTQRFKMVPGEVISKKPTASIVAGSEAAYLFVKITETNNAYNTNDKYVKWEIAEGWKLVEGTTDVYWREVAAGDNKEYEILKGNQVTINTEITVDEMAAIVDTLPQLTFQAYACQSANVADAKTAWSYVGNDGKTPVANN